MAAQLDLTVVGNAVDVARHDAIIQAIAGAAAAEAEPLVACEQAVPCAARAGTAQCAARRNA